MEPMSSAKDKTDLFEKMLRKVNVDNLDLVRKFAWVLSKLYYQQSLVTMNNMNINQAMFEIQQALYYID